MFSRFFRRGGSSRSEADTSEQQPEQSDAHGKHGRTGIVQRVTSSFVRSPSLERGDPKSPPRAQEDEPRRSPTASDVKKKVGGLRRALSVERGSSRGGDA